MLLFWIFIGRFEMFSPPLIALGPRARSDANKIIGHTRAYWSRNSITGATPARGDAKKSSPPRK
jgi:hypothetical protein